jgi:hypothetical protein
VTCERSPGDEALVWLDPSTTMKAVTARMRARTLTGPRFHSCSVASQRVVRSAPAPYQSLPPALRKRKLPESGRAFTLRLEAICPWAKMSVYPRPDDSGSLCTKSERRPTRPSVWSGTKLAGNGGSRDLIRLIGTSVGYAPRVSTWSCGNPFAVYDSNSPSALMGSSLAASISLKNSRLPIPAINVRLV